MKILSLFLLSLFIFPLYGKEPKRSRHISRKKPVWADEFNYTGLPDSTKWGYERGFVRNQEAQYYTYRRPENVVVRDGMLVITARKERYPNPGYVAGSDNWMKNREYAEYTSGSITTQGKFSVRYGRIEVRARVPSGRGTWPAIWMLGTNIPQVGWPRCGEIDIMEFLGRDSSLVYGTCHWADNPVKSHASQGKHISVTPPPSADFHVYAVNWSPKKITFFYDDRKYFTYKIKKAGKDPGNPFRKPFYLILNLALGGWGGTIDDAVMPRQFLIDYVRIYPLKKTKRQREKDGVR